jgi:hypothetical protein
MSAMQTCAGAAITHAATHVAEAATEPAPMATSQVQLTQSLENHCQAQFFLRLN